MVTFGTLIILLVMFLLVVYIDMYLYQSTFFGAIHWIFAADAVISLRIVIAFTVFGLLIAVRMDIERKKHKAKRDQR
jgi:hypothetical protein